MKEMASENFVIGNRFVSLTLLSDSLSFIDREDKIKSISHCSQPFGIICESIKIQPGSEHRLHKRGIRMEFLMLCKMEMKIAHQFLNANATFSIS